MARSSDSILGALLIFLLSVVVTVGAAAWAIADRQAPEPAAQESTR